MALTNKTNLTADQQAWITKAQDYYKKMDQTLCQSYDRLEVKPTITNVLEARQFEVKVSGQLGMEDSPLLDNKSEIDRDKSVINHFDVGDTSSALVFHYGFNHEALGEKIIVQLKLNAVFRALNQASQTDYSSEILQKCNLCITYPEFTQKVGITLPSEAEIDKAIIENVHKWIDEHYVGDKGKIKQKLQQYDTLALLTIFSNAKVCTQGKTTPEITEASLTKSINLYHKNKLDNLIFDWVNTSNSEVKYKAFGGGKDINLKAQYGIATQHNHYRVTTAVANTLSNQTVIDAYKKALENKDNNPIDEVLQGFKDVLTNTLEAEKTKLAENSKRNQSETFKAFYQWGQETAAKLNTIAMPSIF